VAERRGRPWAVRLQAQAVAYFVPARPAAELCGAAFARHVGRAYATVKNGVTNINALKRAALRDKALGALCHLASGAQFIDQVSARHVSIVIGIRPDLVKSLRSAELDCTRASLRVRRKGRKGGNCRLADGIPTVEPALMQEPFFFDGGVVDLATDTWDFLRYPKVHRVVSKADLRPDLADVAWMVLRQALRTGREISTMKNLWWGFVCAASVLDGFVDALQQAELPTLQAAWYTTVKRDSRSKLVVTRSALCRWLEEVLHKPLEPADAQRLARVIGWLRETPLPRRGDAGTALSTDAFAQLQRLRADAIVAGRGRDWPVDASQLSRSARWAFNRWSIALMALVSGTTGAATAEPGADRSGRLGGAPTRSLLAVLEARQEAQRTRRRAGAWYGTRSRRVQAAVLSCVAVWPRRRDRRRSGAQGTPSYDHVARFQRPAAD
jgi:hypothetical protein